MKRDSGTDNKTLVVVSSAVLFGAATLAIVCGAMSKSKVSVASNETETVTEIAESLVSEVRETDEITEVTETTETDYIEDTEVLLADDDSSIWGNSLEMYAFDTLNSIISYKIEVPMEVVGDDIDSITYALSGAEFQLPNPDAVETMSCYDNRLYCDTCEAFRVKYDCQSLLYSGGKVSIMGKAYNTQIVNLYANGIAQDEEKDLWDDISNFLLRNVVMLRTINYNDGTEEKEFVYFGSADNNIFCSDKHIEYDDSFMNIEVSNPVDTNFYGDGYVIELGPINDIDTIPYGELEAKLLEDSMSNAELMAYYKEKAEDYADKYPDAFYCFSKDEFGTRMWLCSEASETCLEFNHATDEVTEWSPEEAYIRKDHSYSYSALSQIPTLPEYYNSIDFHDYSAVPIEKYYSEEADIAEFTDYVADGDYFGSILAVNRDAPQALVYLGKPLYFTQEQVDEINYISDGPDYYFEKYEDGYVLTFQDNGTAYYGHDIHLAYVDLASEMTVSKYTWFEDEGYQLIDYNVTNDAESYSENSCNFFDIPDLMELMPGNTKENDEWIPLSCRCIPMTIENGSITSMMLGGCP